MKFISSREIRSNPAHLWEVTGNIRQFKGTDVIAMTPAEFLSGTLHVSRE